MHNRQVSSTAPDRIRLIRAAIIVLTLFTLSGCIDLQQTLTLTGNGSGKYELAYSISDESINNYKSMRELTGTLREHAGALGISTENSQDESHYLDLLLNPDEAVIRKAIESQASYGLKLEKLTLEVRDAVRFVRLVVAFKNINDLAKAPWFEEHGFSLIKQQGAWLFYRPPESGNNPIPALTDKDEIQALTPVLHGFHVASTFRAPGRVLKSTGSAEPPFNVSWTFDFDRNVNALSALQNQQLQVLFECPDARFTEIRLARHFQRSANKP